MNNPITFTPAPHDDGMNTELWSMLHALERSCMQTDEQVLRHVENVRFDLDRIESAVKENYSASFTSSSAGDLRSALELRYERAQRLTELRWAYIHSLTYDQLEELIDEYSEQYGEDEYLNAITKRADAIRDDA